jgi:hypothetical protein
MEKKTKTKEELKAILKKLKAEKQAKIDNKTLIKK